MTKEEKEIQNSLKSNDKKIVLGTIEKFRRNGSSKLIFNLLDLLVASEEEDIQKSIVNVLNDLKDQSVVSTMVDAIQDTRYVTVLPVILSSCWQSGLDYSEYYGFFTKLVVELSYSDAIEAFSVIEQSIEKFNITEDECKKQKRFIKNCIGDVDEDKKALLEELIKVYE